METILSWIFILGVITLVMTTRAYIHKSVADLNDRIDHCQTTLAREISKEIDERIKRAITDKKVAGGGFEPPASGL